MPPETAQKKFFYIRALIGNREAIKQKKKKKDFEHQRIKEEQEEKIEGKNNERK